MRIEDALATSVLAVSVALAGCGAEEPGPATARDAAALSATVSGGYATATGSTAAATTVSTLAQLQSAVAAGQHHIVVSGTISGGAKPVTITFASTSWNNTTIEGAAGGGAVLENVQLKFSGEQLAAGTNIQNLVVKNLTFRGNIPALQALSGADTQPGGIGTNYLGLSFRRCTNVWVDHVTIYDTSDDLFLVSLASDNVTVSWSHFYFSPAWLGMSPDPIWNWVGSNQDLAGERLAMLIGQSWSDSSLYGGGVLHVTMHHNWFGPNLRGRPLMRGFVHLYDNYFTNDPPPTGNNAAGYAQGQYNANQIGSGGVVYSESNYFYKTNQTTQVGLDDTTHTSYQYYERNNTYSATTGSRTAGAAFPASLPFPYAYTVDATANVPSVVQGSAGPR
jgi:pectate lyase